MTPTEKHKAYAVYDQLLTALVNIEWCLTTDQQEYIYTYLRTAGFTPSFTPKLISLLKELADEAN